MEHSVLLISRFVKYYRQYVDWGLSINYVASYGGREGRGIRNGRGRGSEVAHNEST